MNKENLKIMVLTLSDNTKRYVPCCKSNTVYVFYEIINQDLSITKMNADFKGGYKSIKEAQDILDEYYNLHYLNFVKSIETISYNPPIKSPDNHQAKKMNERYLDHLLNKINFNDKKPTPESKLPKQWEVVPYKTHYFINSYSDIQEYVPKNTNKPDDNNLLPTEEIANQVLALEQLLTMREVYRDGWKPNGKLNYTIYRNFTNEGDYHITLIPNRKYSPTIS